jgi:hypothetical protein
MYLVVENRRTFFDKFAKAKKFNPLDADKWYSITRNEVLHAVSWIIILIYKSFCEPFFQGGKGILQYYGRSHIRALRALYPELKLSPDKFLRFKG